MFGAEYTSGGQVGLDGKLYLKICKPSLKNRRKTVSKKEKIKLLLHLIVSRLGSSTPCWGILNQPLLLSKSNRLSILSLFTVREP
jgi:hypothetical protein